MVEHLIKNGNERVVEEARDHMFKIRTLTDFNFYEGAIDRGNGGECQCEHPKRSLSIFTVLISWNSTSIRRSLFQTVREKARNVIELLQDNARIREERDKARQLREKFSGFSGQRDSGYGGYAGGGEVAMGAIMAAVAVAVAAGAVTTSTPAVVMRTAGSVALHFRPGGETVVEAGRSDTVIVGTPGAAILTTAIAALSRATTVDTAMS